MSGSSRGREAFGSSLEKRETVEEMHSNRVSNRRERNSESDGDTGENDKEHTGHLGSQTPPLPQAGMAHVLCGICHTPFGTTMAPLKAIMSKCAICL